MGFLCCRLNFVSLNKMENQKAKHTLPKPEHATDCPAEGLLKTLSGKWKARIYKLAIDGPLRFNSLLRQIPDANKQSLSVALKELEENGILVKVIVAQKPLHIEYHLSERGRSLLPIFETLEQFNA